MAVYFDRRMLVLFGLGFSSGLPLKLVYATLALWLASAGIDKATVGLLGLASLPYSLKFLWAPMLDRVAPGPLDRWVGRRRGWMLLSQLGLMLSLFGMASTDPSVDVARTAAFAVLVAFWSATQDIAVDGYRVELLEVEEQGAGTAMAVMGYRVGMLVSGAGALHVVAALGEAGGLARWAHSLHDSPLYPWVIDQGAWNLTYRLLACFVLVGALSAWLAPRPPEDARTHGGTHGTGEGETPVSIVSSLLSPFVAFVQRPGTRFVIGFLLFFKLGDSLASAMTNTFLYEIGFTLRQIADIRDSWGLAASIVGIATGGVVVRSLGLRSSLWGSLGLMMGSNLLFSWLAIVGNSAAWLLVTIGIENLTGGIATAAFVAWLSAQCERRYAATQYALLTSLAALAHISLGAGSGWMAERVGWVAYFVWTAVASVPAVVLLLFRPNLVPAESKKSAEADATS